MQITIQRGGFMQSVKPLTRKCLLPNTIGVACTEVQFGFPFDYTAKAYYQVKSYGCPLKKHTL